MRILYLILIIGLIVGCDKLKESKETKVFVYPASLCTRDTLNNGETYNAKIFLVNKEKLKGLYKTDSLKMWYYFNPKGGDYNEVRVINDTGVVEFSIPDSLLKEGLNKKEWYGLISVPSLNLKERYDTFFVVPTECYIRR